MVVAIAILLSFVTPCVRPIAALIGGIGFGAFIDEIGKFVTSDNNYFFKPTAALIYVVFAVLVLAVRWVRRFGTSNIPCRCAAAGSYGTLSRVAVRVFVKVTGVRGGRWSPSPSVLSRQGLSEAPTMTEP